MKRLTLRREPIRIEIDAELSVSLRPLRHVEIVRALAAVPQAPRAVGLDQRGEQMVAVADMVPVAVALAMAAVDDWTVSDADTGERLPVTEDVAGAMFGDDLALASVFVQRVLDALTPPAEALEREKNASAPLPNGSTAGATNTAEHATDPVTTARPD